jgi:hypothetical protein
VADEWLYVVVAAGAVAIALVLLYATRTGRKKKKEPPEKPTVEARESWLARALKTERTISVDEAKKAKEEMKTLDLEREILSFAIRRLYEAQAEGKITEEERERLAQWYKSRMMEVRDTIARSESVVALHELETMQEDLVKLFSERFDELSKKVEDMRTQLQLKPVEEETIVPTAPSPPEPSAESEKEKKKMRKRPPPTPPRKTEAEKRIEEIKAEVEKVLERLGQIEVEG